MNRNDISTDLSRNGKHQDITMDLILMISHDQQLKDLFEKSIFQAHQINPDPDTNPIDSLEAFYDFIDHCAVSMPWRFNQSKRYTSLYDRIDQSMGLMYFACDQPLKELEGKGYYHNSLIYHEPYRSWFISFLSKYCLFMDDDRSWCPEYEQIVRSDAGFPLEEYEDPSHWHCFNDFFTRKLRDPGLRPIASSDDERIVVSPADAACQGIWKIDEEGKVEKRHSEESHGVAIKTGTLNDVSVFLNGSNYKDAFKGGTLTHTFLDIGDYHRYHFPVDGTILETAIVRADDAPGGVITWDEENQRYKEYFSESFGWQSLETRAYVILELKSGGLCAVSPIGMCQVASVNLEEEVKPGAVVRKGDPLGYFKYGGSDIVMIFSKDAGFSLSAGENEYLKMGEAYGRLTRMY